MLWLSATGRSRPRGLFPTVAGCRNNRRREQGVGGFGEGTEHRNGSQRLTGLGLLQVEQGPPPRLCSDESTLPLDGDGGLVE